MAERRVQVDNPNSFKDLSTITIEVTATVPATITDMLLQAGTTGTAWLPNVTEMPWIAGVVAQP